MEHKNIWTKYNAAQVAEIMSYNDGYKAYISECKTERECVARAVQDAEAHGYLDLKEIIREGKTVKAGDKVYFNNMGKALVLFHVGTEELEKGMKILGAHIDSPRMDLKQNPLYEDTELAFLDTHYYGGIKKYQWVTLPLALHGEIGRAHV